MYATIVNFHKFSEVPFYSIQFVEDELCETDKFIERIDEMEDFKEQLDDLLALIESIGARKAKYYYFRHEGIADALPPNRRYWEYLDVSNKELNLRLYCMRLSDNIVILFNGGVKTMQKAQECPNVSFYFYQAGKLTKKILRKIIDKEIIIDDKDLLGDLEFEY